MAENEHARPRPIARQSSSGNTLTVIKMTSPREALIVMPLARAWHAESIYSHLPFSERKFLTQVLRALARKDDGATFYAVRKGEAVGVIDMAAGEAWMSEGGRYATCLARFVRSGVRRTLLGGAVAQRLADQGRKWAEETGASALFFNGTHGDNNSRRRLGETVGRNVTINTAVRSS